VSTHLMTVPSADAHGHTARVQVTGGQVGGWDVTATLNGRVVASRHCDDWHRTERARRADHRIADTRPTTRRSRRPARHAARWVDRDCGRARSPSRTGVRDRHRADGHLRRTARHRARYRLRHADAWPWQRGQERLLFRDVEHAYRRRLDYGRPRLSVLAVRRSDVHRRIGGGFMAGGRRIGAVADWSSSRGKTGAEKPTMWLHHPAPDKGREAEQQRDPEPVPEHGHAVPFIPVMCSRLAEDARPRPGGAGHGFGRLVTGVHCVVLIVPPRRLSRRFHRVPRTVWPNQVARRVGGVDRM
jgi:hypothetical protein